MSKLNNYCLLCYEAKCTKECGVFNPDRILRSIYFDNVHVIKNSIDDNIPCFDCDGRCQSACPIKIDIKGYKFGYFLIGTYSYISEESSVTSSIIL